MPSSVSPAVGPMPTRPTFAYDRVIVTRVQRDACEDSHEPVTDPLDQAARLLDDALREQAAEHPAQALTS
jgi:hypothetical protein